MSIASRGGAGDRNLAGIGLMALAVFLFSVNDTLGKWLAERYSAPQILLFRSIAAMAILFPLAVRIGFRQVARPPRFRMQVVRAVFGALETGLFYAAVSYLPPADAMTFYLAGPIYVTLLAALFLGERVGWRRWTAVLAGFIGVTLALQPSIAGIGWPTLIPLAGSMVYAIFLVTTRSLRGTPDAIMAFWQVSGSLVIGIVGTPLVWRPLVHWYDGALLALLGVVALGAIVCTNRSLKLAAASVVIPYQYMLIVWATLFGYLVFGDVPHRLTLIGAAVIIGAGLFIFFREQRLAKVSEPDLPPER